VNCVSLSRALPSRNARPALILSLPARYEQKRTPLHVAADIHSAEVVQALMELKAVVDARDVSGKEYLWVK
jgi:hypothetical protein